MIYYRRDLAFIHDRGFGFHADACAPGILGLLEGVRLDNGLVVELGCGSGRLTRHLLDAGLRVIATDASPAMLDLAREAVPDAEDIRLLALPQDPVPEADAVVSVGHVLNYLPDEAAIDGALGSVADALTPGGVMIMDICDLSYLQARSADTRMGWAGEDWAIVTEFSSPSPTRFVRDMTTFVRNEDGSYRRDDERHVNVLVDATAIPALLSGHGVEAVIGGSFGEVPLPTGLRSIVGHRPVSS